MKKRIWIIVIIVFVAILAVGFLKGCLEDSSFDKELLVRLDSAPYPLYNSLNEKEKEFYRSVCTAAEKFQKEAFVTYESEAECKAIMEKFKPLMQTLLCEQPQYFWINPNKCFLKISEVDKKYRLCAELEYLVEKDVAMEKKEAFDQKVDEIVTAAKAKKNTFDQILYVHDYILSNVSYDEDLTEKKDFKNLNISAYGCLVEGKTICSGYALAFNLIMRELGYECGNEFNNYGNFSAFDGHVWNYCKLDGEYYYFDLTWDDTGNYEGVDYKYEYFGISKNELKLTNLLKQEDAPVPVCNGEKYNYYIYNGYNISEYSFEAVQKAILDQNPQGYVTLRFDSYKELLHAESELFTNGRIFEILGDVKNVKHGISRSNLYLNIFYDE